MQPRRLRCLHWFAEQNIFVSYHYGKKFLVRSDHSALTYLRNLAENNSRPLQWSLKLSELDFTVEHRAGSKIPHVDALSRHVGTVIHEDNLDRSNILHEQAEHAFCVKQKPGIYSSRGEFFLNDEGAMYRRQTDNKHELVVPKTIIHHIIKVNHDPVYVAHPGVKRTYDLVSLNYWWPGMRNSIKDYVKICDSCQRRKEEREFLAPLDDVDQPSAPLKLLLWT